MDFRELCSTHFLCCCSNPNLPVVPFTRRSCQHLAERGICTEEGGGQQGRGCIHIGAGRAGPRMLPKHLSLPPWRSPKPASPHSNLPELKNSPRWEGTSKDRQVQPLVGKGSLKDIARHLLQSLLETSNDEDSATSLGSLFQWLMVLSVKKNSFL